MPASPASPPPSGPRAPVACARLRGRRLRRHAEFVVAQRSGRRVTTPHFVLLVAAQPEAQRGPSRIGLVVSRSVGPAVARNRVKRVCRECFRAWADLVPPGVDLVVIARPGSHALGLEGVRSEWRRVSGLIMKRSAEALGPARRP